MKFVVAADYSALCREAADRVEALVRAKPRAVLGLPTGETPVGVYHELTRRVRESRLALPVGEGRGEGLDLSLLTIFVLDEYLDVGRGDSRCLADWLDRDLIRPGGIDPARVHAFDGLTSEPMRACAEYEAAIRAAGGIDLQLLGLGLNGHVGFNEPGSPPDSRSRVVRLAPESIAANARYWGPENRVPHYGLTMGVATLVEAREIILLVSGAGKASVLREALQGPTTNRVPASLLRDHPNFTFLADNEAAAELKQ